VRGVGESVGRPVNLFLHALADDPDERLMFIRPAFNRELLVQAVHKKPGSNQRGDCRQNESEQNFLLLGHPGFVS
jgi:hypothetical protein